MIVATLAMLGRLSATVVSVRVDPPSAVWVYRSDSPPELSGCRPSLIKPACIYYQSEQEALTARRHSNIILAGFLAIAFVLWLLYLAIGNAFGTSLGKALFGLRVVSLKAKRPRRWVQGVTRTAGYLVSALPIGLGFLSILWSPRRRAWHDYIAGTACIRRESAQQREDNSRAPAIAAAVSLLAIAFAGPTAAASLFIPTPASDAQQAQDVDNPAVLEDVLIGYKAISDRYVDIVDAPTLLTSAWSGAIVRAQLADVELPPERAQNIQTEKELRYQLFMLGKAAEGKLTESQLTFAAIEAMAASLNDDHTYFITPSRAKLINDGKSSSLGAQVVTHKDPSGLLIWAVDAGSVAERVGLRPGDVLTKIDGIPARSVTTEPGKRVSLTLVRPDAGEITLQATGEVRPDLRLDSRMLDGRIAYVSLNSFSTSSGSGFAERLDAELESLVRQGAESWILDLRNNPGGLALNAAIVAGRFGLDAPLLTNHLRGGREQILKPMGPALFQDAPGVILINERSASSSEIVASAMHDAAAAYLIGTRTSGKVNLSRTFPVAGGLLHVTIARTGIGFPERSLSGIGVQPDEVIVHSVVALSSNHDLQLERAVAYLHATLNAESNLPP